MLRPIVRLACVLLFAGCAGSEPNNSSTVATTEPDDEHLEQNAEESSTAAANHYATMDWISIDTEGWDSKIDGRKVKAWTDKDGDMLYLTLFSRPEVKGNGLPEDFPNLERGLKKLRDYRRAVALEHQSGFVQADLKTLKNNILASVSIAKTRQDSRGFEFTGLCVIPRKDFSIWIMVSSSETGLTGFRETAVAQELLQSGVVKLEFPEDGKPGKMTGFYQDPYDPQHHKGALYNLSDQKKYDSRFPRSPLTRVRTKLKQVIDSIVLSSKAVESEPYTGPPTLTPSKSNR